MSHSLPVEPSWPYCPLCAQRADLVQGAFGMFYVCSDCDTRIGCKPGTATPLGPLATKRTRDLRVEAHRVFDTLVAAKVKRGGITRGRARDFAYAWLAQELGIGKLACHFSLFSDDQLVLAIALCTPRAERLRAWMNRGVSDAP